MRDPKREARGRGRIGGEREGLRHREGEVGSDGFLSRSSGPTGQRETNELWTGEVESGTFEGL